MPAPSVSINLWWLFLSGAFAAHAAILWLIYGINRDVVAMLYAIITTCLWLIVTINAVVRTTVFFDPVTLVAFQRGIYAPLLLCIVALIDIYLAEHNGHLSVLRRLTRWWERD